MEALLDKFKCYLREVLGIAVRISDWPGRRNLPFFLRDRYAFLTSEILGSPCLLIIPKEESNQTPATVKKQIVNLREKWDGEIIYVRRNISSYNRKRLIEQGVAFVIPGNQLYLPFLGVRLQEHYRETRIERKKFRPATQAVVLCFLLNRFKGKYALLGLADKLGYTPMTLTRAFDELEQNGIGIIFHIGRQRVLQFPPDKRALWEKARTYMISPVRKRIRIKETKSELCRIRSGLTALSHYSMLSAPAVQTYAIPGKTWKSMAKRNHIKRLQVAEETAFELELWHYDPGLFAKDGIADPFSLYLSLQGTEDERVETALNEMMENIEW
jgi:DNA-binding MarR family transcriptional regulator